ANARDRASPDSRRHRRVDGAGLRDRGRAQALEAGVRLLGEDAHQDPGGGVRSAALGTEPSTVIAGHSASDDARERAYDPAIHLLRKDPLAKMMDARVKPAHDGLNPTTVNEYDSGEPHTRA